MTQASTSPVARLMNTLTQVKPHEARAAALAFMCNFVLLGSYYILRPLRDTMGTVFGVDQLQNLFTVTFFITFLCAPIYSGLASRIKLTKFLPGLFWFWFSNILLFYVLFMTMPQNRWLAAAYFWWFSVVNLFLISVFWTFMADIFSDKQASRLFPVIQAGGSTGAIAGPVITALFVRLIGVGGLLLVAAGGFLIVIFLVYALIREKERLKTVSEEAQRTTLDHTLAGNPFDGFGLLLKSTYMLNQAAFMLMMTWIATFIYFLQTDLIAKSYSDVERRTVAFADLDLVVNISAALILIFGLGRLIQRFGVTAGLVLSPLTMVCAFLGVGVIPTLFMVQTARGVQRITQYSVARTSREILFTVVDQESKYKAKNVIDTVVYRFGDVTAAWMQTGLRLAGFGILGVAALGVTVSLAWGLVAIALGRRYESIRTGEGGRKPAALAAEERA